MNLKEMLGFKEVFLIVICLALSVLFVVFARNAYPVPGGDSEFFLTPALQLSNKGVLTIPLFPDENEINKIDPSGAKRFLIYPPLFPLILNHGMTGASPVDVFLTIAVLNIIAILLSAWFFYKKAKENGGLDWSKTLLIIFGILALASGLIGGSGRPEILGSLWVVFGLLVYFYAKKYDWVFYGILLGLMFATHLTGGIIAFLILSAFFAAKLNLRELFVKFSGVLAIGLITFLITIKLGPFGIWETIVGTVKNALAVSAGYAAQLSEWFTLKKFIQYYFLSPVTPFYAFVVVLMLVVGWFFYRKYKNRIVSPVIFTSCSIGLLIILGSMIYSVGHIFYLLIFAPLIFLGFIVYFSESGVVSKVGIFLTLALVSTAFIRTTALYPVFLKTGLSFTEVREVFNKMRKEYENTDVKFGITGSFWSLSEDYDRMYVYVWPDKPREKTALIFFQQKYSGLLNPPEIQGCGLLVDKFSREAPSLFGIKLGNTAPGYSYAIYKCQSS